MPKAKSTHDIKWEDYFYYDESSPTFLRHSKDRRNVKKDAVAGSIKKHGGYSSVKLDYKLYLVHRVIWELLHGKLDVTDKVDHIDGDTCNNRVSNLRVVSEDVNQRNRAMPKSNTTGYAGVTYNVSGYWQANWYAEDGKMYSKYFSLRKYDYITAKLYAILYRQTVMKKLIDLGLGYTERHGCKM